MRFDSFNEVWEEIESEIQDAEELLSAIKQKFAEAKQIDTERHQLQDQESELKSKLSAKLPTKSNAKAVNIELWQYHQELKSQLQTVQTQLQEIETSIFSEMITLSIFKEPFWQIVRFSGLGFLLGFFLKSCVG